MVLCCDAAVLQQAVQFSINATYLADQVCTFLEREIEVRAENKQERPPLSARKLFEATRIRCEDLMFELVPAVMLL